MGVTRSSTDPRGSSPRFVVGQIAVLDGYLREESGRQLHRRRGTRRGCSGLQQVAGHYGLFSVMAGTYDAGVSAPLPARTALIPRSARAVAVESVGDLFLLRPS